MTLSPFNIKIRRINMKSIPEPGAQAMKLFCRITTGDYMHRMSYKVFKNAWEFLVLSDDEGANTFSFRRLYWEVHGHVYVHVGT